MIKQLHKRINNDLGLRFTGTKHAVITNAPDITSFSFCINKIVDSGTIMSKPGQVVSSSAINSSINEFTFVLFNGDGKIFINGSENGSHILDWSSVADITINGQAGGEDFVLSNLVLYDKSFTDAEAKVLWQNIGSIQKIEHDNILNHWTLNQKSYFKADAAFIIKHPQLALNDIVAIDSVEEYNSPLTPLHGKLVNYTDVEIVDNNHKVFNTKSKSIAFTGGIKFNGASELLFTNDAYDIAIGESVSIEWLKSGIYASISHEFGFIDAGITSGLYFQYNGSGQLSAIIDQNTINATGFLFDFPVSSNVRHFILNLDNSQTEIIDNNGGVLGNLTPTSVIRLTVDGITYSPSRIHRRNGIGIQTTYFYDGSDSINMSPLNIGGRSPGTFRTFNTLFALIFYRKMLSGEEMLSRFRNKFTYPNELDGDIEDAYSFTTKLPKSIKSADVIASTVGMTDSVYLVDSKSGLPEIKEGLLIETGISISKSYVSIVGMGFAFQLLTDIAALSEIITGLPAITGFYINGNSVVDEAALITAININDLCHIDLEFASSSPTITFVHTGEDYYLIRDYYLNALLSIKEKKTLINNILLENPSPLVAEKMLYYALHNSNDYIEGGAEPENVPLIGTGNRQSLGWTGGTVADRLTDLLSNVVTINSLR